MKNLSALFSKIISNHDKDSHCLNCLHSFSTKNKLKDHKNVCKNHYYCHIEMPKRDKNILKYNHGEKSLKILFITYVDIEPLLEK